MGVLLAQFRQCDGMTFPVKIISVKTGSSPTQLKALDSDLDRHSPAAV